MPETSTTAKHKPTKDLDIYNGLLSPDGKFYECEFTGHGKLGYELCRQLGYETTSWPLDHLLYKLGWARVSCSDRESLTGNRWFIYNRSYGTDFSRLTQKQRDFIFDWCQNNSLELPEKMREEMSLSK